MPKKAIAEILKMDTTAEDANLSIRHSENHLHFSVGGRQLIARLLDVNLPDYEKIQLAWSRSRAIYGMSQGRIGRFSTMRSTSMSRSTIAPPSIAIGKKAAYTVGDENFGIMAGRRRFALEPPGGARSIMRRA